jgi:hypothetical protein
MFRAGISGGIGGEMGRDIRLSVLMLLLAAVFGACGSESGGGVEVETIDGVEHVHNPARPLEPQIRVSFERDLVIEAEDEKGEILFYRPSGILVDSEDYMYVSDYRDGVIRVFDPEGNPVRTIGRKGQGPGENQVISAAALLPGGRLLVLDHRSRRSSLFDTAGKFLGSHPWRQSHFELFWADETGYLTDETLYEPETILLVKRFALDGNEIETWGRFSPFQMHIERQGDMAVSLSIPYAPQSIFAGDPVRKRLYHCRNDVYRIEVYQGPADPVLVFDRPYDPVPFTGADAEEFYASVDRRNNPTFSELARKVVLPEVKTVAEGMGVDDLGFLWVKTNEIREEEGRRLNAYDGFDPDGRYRFRIWLDFRPGPFVRGKMYRIHHDEETGFSSVFRYRVIRGE